MYLFLLFSGHTAQLTLAACVRQMQKKKYILGHMEYIDLLAFT